MDVRARHLGDGAWRRNVQASASSSSPSISPSESYGPTNIPTSMPTIRGSNFGLTLLYVSGVSLQHLPAMSLLSVLTGAF
eukprot:scaffold20979_cov108-Cylindrotheca_fusiformis.AAC.1